MALSAGTTLGPYSVTAKIGEGGMGEVWRATDTTLDRDVALKVLPEAFTSDPDRLARFEREAKVLASLNHPNIGSIYGLEEAEGVRALVLELVEGPTLADRIKQGPIPLDDALPIAKQIAEALEAAHEAGVIHRDLKPANIKVREDGTVKVLDFGLAKALAGDAASDPSESPTLTAAATRAGVIMGTAAYMSPEQARGSVTDRRADIWSYGVVLYEMLTGKRTFEGDLDWQAVPSRTPAVLRRMLGRCLDKNPRRRLQAIGEARVQIEDLIGGTSEETAAVRGLAPEVSRRERVAWVAAAVLAVIAAGAVSIAVWLASRPAPAAPEMHVEISTPPDPTLVSLAVSPTGREIVFVASDQDQSSLWVRSLESGRTRRLAGTDGALLPFWSPDTRSIGFFADDQLKRVEIDGSSIQTLAPALTGRGGTWHDDGSILFAPTATDALFRVPATGGDVVQVTTLAAGQNDHRSPQFLPDGRHFLYYARGSSGASGVYVGQLDGTETRRLLDADAGAVYAATGHVIFVRQGALFAQAFDATRLSLSGDPVRLAEQVVVAGGISVAALSTSATGSLVYRAGSRPSRQLVWFDRAGQEISRVGDVDSAVMGMGGLSLSPDGRRLALHRNVSENWDIWLLDMTRGVFSRFTFDLGIDWNPIWSSDGRRVAFWSRGGIYQKSAANTEPEELLLEASGFPQDWSLDGQFLLYGERDSSSAGDVLALPLDGDRTPIPVATANFNERAGQFSPDGKWIAYESDESGQVEVYIQPFPGPGGKVRVSTDGGAQALWRRDGNELFYIALDDRLMAVPIRFPPSDQTAEADSPVPLFTTHVGGALQGLASHNYVVSSDGQRFLMNTIIEEATPPITVILNWKPRK